MVRGGSTPPLFFTKFPKNSKFLRFLQANYKQIKRNYLTCRKIKFLFFLSKIIENNKNVVYLQCQTITQITKYNNDENKQQKN